MLGKIKTNICAITAVTIVAFSTLASAAPEIYDSKTGQYLGNLSSNKYDPDSVSNPYGRYGSQYSPDSINNPYSAHGSPYSPTSVNNPYASSPPVIRGR
jgi:hypothetical protein